MFRLVLALLLVLPTLSGSTLAQPPAAWSFAGRTVERRSTSATELLIDFTLLDGEEAVQAVVNCVRATRQALPRATYVYCAAYTPAAYRVLSGKLRLCYSASVNWFADAGMYRLSLPQDDPRYPKSCPALT